MAVKWTREFSPEEIRQLIIDQVKREGVTITPEMIRFNTDYDGVIEGVTVEIQSDDIKEFAKFISDLMTK